MGKYYHGEFRQYTRTVYDATVGLPGAAESLCCDADGRMLAACGGGIYLLADGSAIALPAFEGKAIRRLRACENRTLAVGGTAVYEVVGSEIGSGYSFDETCIDACLSRDGVLWVLTESGLYRQEQDAFVFLTDVPGSPRSLDAFRENRVYVGADCGLLALTGKRWHWSELTSEWSGLCDNDVKCVRFDTLGNIWAATAKGVCVYDDRNCWKTPNTVQNLPCGDICDMFFAADGTKYFACSCGLIVLSQGVLDYYTYKRWLPHPGVVAVSASAAGKICAATANGVSVMNPQMMTLESKADYFDTVIDRFFTRRDGYMCTRRLTVPGEMETGELYAGDNDGLYTGLYMAAQCFRYAVTKSPDALSRARRSLRAMLKLVDVCGDTGFVARAIRYADESDYQTGVRKEWRMASDGTEWKGETSSDEITGHMYAYAVYFDLCADETEKQEIAQRVARIADHILAHDFRMVDADGEPTTWANWKPELLNHDNKWCFEQGINSLEILSYLTTAEHITGDAKYGDALRRLVTEHHYDLNVMKYKIRDGHITHIDDQLAFNVLYPLLAYTRDADLRAILMMGLADHWQYERIEHTPLFNAVYGYFSGRVCDVQMMAETLAQIPLDTTLWQAFNSWIPGLVWDDEQEQYGNPSQLKEPLPYHLRPLYQGDCSPFCCDAGNDDFLATAETAGGLFYNPSRRGDNGLCALNPLFYLQPYWAARYFGLLGD